VRKKLENHFFNLFSINTYKNKSDPTQITYFHDVEFEKNQNRNKLFEGAILNKRDTQSLFTLSLYVYFYYYTLAIFFLRDFYLSLFFILFSSTDSLGTWLKN
jgi:hypothetical protein